MKHLNASLSSIVVGVFALTFFAISSHRWVNHPIGDVVFCIASILVMLCLPYYMDIIKQSKKWQKIIIVCTLFIFSAAILCYNVILWTVFTVFFLLLYICLQLVKNPDVGAEEMPYQYFFRKKQYLRRALFVMFPYVLAYWSVILAIRYNIIPISL